MRWLADVTVDPDEARRRAAEILSRAEFQPPRRGVIERILDWIGRQLGRLFSTLGGGGGGGGALFGWIVVLAVVAGIVVLVVVGLRRARGGLRTDDADETTVVTSQPTSAEAWRAEAAAHAAAGRWREALRCRYRAVEAELAERGLLVTAPGTTTGGERAQVAERVPALAEPFAEVADAFDLGVYGGDPLGPEALARADELDRALDADVARQEA